MTTKWLIFLRPSFMFIFQKIHQTSRLTWFLQRKKRFKKWWKLRILSCFEDHSYTEIRLPDGSPKSCKMTPKCITNHREMSMKKYRFRSCNAQKRTPSTDLQNYMKTRSLLSYRCCFAYAMDAKIVQNHWNFTMKSPQKVRMPVLQWSATHVVYRPANMHQNALMFVVTGVALLTPWMRNSFK